jgi:hypothetical protein
MCCGCCCGVLKNLKTLKKPAEVIHTNYYAQVDEEAMHRLAKPAWSDARWTPSPSMKQPA